LDRGSFRISHSGAGPVYTGEGYRIGQGTGSVQLSPGSESWVIMHHGHAFTGIIIIIHRQMI
jgi:hypothetical protein